MGCSEPQHTKDGKNSQHIYKGLTVGHSAGTVRVRGTAGRPAGEGLKLKKNSILT